MTSKRFKTTVIEHDKSTACGIEIPFDPREVFGKVRAPVTATLRGHTYRTTIASMGGCYFIPLAKKNREAAGVKGGDTLFVTLEHDDKPRNVKPPTDLIAAFRQHADARAAWDALSFTHQREHVEAIEGARRPATRERRIARTVEMLTSAPKAKKESSVGGVSSEAVRKKTGKGWTQWLTLLDKAGGKSMTHKAIVALLREEYDVEHWWAQQITVGYEQERQGRQKHEKPGGYEISVSKTINVSVADLYTAWKDKRRRRRWLPEADFTVRKATPEKSMRITWVDDITHVDAYFDDKGSGKSRISVQHKKLEAAQAEPMKTLWRERLAGLKTMLERG